VQVTAHAAFTLAGRRALATARGPGTLSTNLLDELYLLEPEQLAEVEVTLG
jgi:hydroxyethylthiazole kinase-like sugar kinase family protein